jgi:hypothetical protein
MPRTVLYVANREREWWTQPFPAKVVSTILHRAPKVSKLVDPE